MTVCSSCALASAVILFMYSAIFPCSGIGSNCEAGDIRLGGSYRNLEGRLQQ
jgi:hypothetical protein